jgi:hypothetical protein
MSYAIRCLLKSIQSIHSSVSADERAALIAESTEQAKAWVAKSFAQVSRGDEATDEDEEARVEHEDDDDGGGNGHHLDKLADLVSEAHGMDRASALRWMMHSKEGRAFAVVHKGESQMADTWTKIAKDHGVVALCKMLADDGDAHGIGEAELVDLIGKHDPKPGERQDQTFTRHYMANVEVRKAVQIAKMATLAPMTSGSVDEQRTAINDTEASEAYDQLMKLADAQRATAPFKTQAQAFADAFAANPELARKAAKRPAPTTMYEFPR